MSNTKGSLPCHINMNDYQSEAMRTAAPIDNLEKEIMVAALGLSGEAGEFAELVKKWVAHGHEFDHDAMIKELGDMLWYISYASSALGYNLSCVARENIEKLRKRYPEGFSSELSINREEGAFERSLIEDIE